MCPSLGWLSDARRSPSELAVLANSMFSGLSGGGVELLVFGKVLVAIGILVGVILFLTRREKFSLPFAGSCAVTCSGVRCANLIFPCSEKLFALGGRLSHSEFCVFGLFVVSARFCTRTHCATSGSIR